MLQYIGLTSEYKKVTLLKNYKLNLIHSHNFLIE